MKDKLNKQAFIYQCAMQGFQGSLANPSQQASIASIVRDAEKLWDELQEWETRQLQPAPMSSGETDS